MAIGRIPCGISIPQTFSSSPIDLRLIRDFVPRAEAIDYDSLDKTPAVIRRGRAPSTASSTPAFDPSDIPAFLRKQAD